MEKDNKKRYALGRFFIERTQRIKSKALNEGEVR